MNAKKKKPPLLLEVPLVWKPIISSGIMLLLIAFVYLCKIPNPNMILIAGLVLCSALFGFGGGIIAGVIMLIYTLFFFSTDNSFIRFTPQNAQKVAVSLIGITVDMLLVCFLKLAEVRAFRNIEALTEQLRQENEDLQIVSVTDALTGIRNRMALRQDFTKYRGRDVTVMMLDVDDFKGVNDALGHEEGDRVLQETGELLAAQFGAEHCYRYGGDEFLVIVPGLAEADFRQKLDALHAARPCLRRDGVMQPVDYSIGWVRETLSADYTIGDLFAEADERMYKVKRNKKSAAEQGKKP